jgi:hypothetical protein
VIARNTWRNPAPAGHVGTSELKLAALEAERERAQAIKKKRSEKKRAKRGAS